MSATKESLKNLFKAVGCDGSAKKMTSNELYKIRALLNNTTCGTNIIYCDNPKASPILSHVLGMVFSSLVIVLTKQRHFANHSVGNVVSSDLKKLVPTYKNGESSYLILDRYPTSTQSFMAIVQADPLWYSKTQRRK